jgi:hypothetical protein
MTKEMELHLASETDLHPEIHVKGGCQHMESVDQEKGPRSSVSPRPTTELQQQGVSHFQWRKGGNDFFWIAKQELFCNSNFATGRVFGVRLQNNDCKTSVVSVTARHDLAWRCTL